MVALRSQGNWRWEGPLGTPLGLAKAFDCVDHNKLWKILKEMGTPDHLPCLLSDLAAAAGLLQAILIATTILEARF